MKQFNAGLVDFGGSDSALSKDKGEVDAAAKRCQGNPAWNLPLVFGPVALAYKLDGVTDLTLNGEVAAKIFNGQITTWNDPAIEALNPGKTLPAKPVKVVYRSDESGTTDNFQQYLTAASKGAWTQGAGKKFTGGVGSGAEKSAGVAQADGGHRRRHLLRRALLRAGRKLSIAKIDSGSGAVELTTEKVGKAIEGAKVTGTGNDLVIDLKARLRRPGRGLVPADPGDLRDRLLEGLRRRHREGRQGVPADRGHHRPGQPGRRGLRAAAGVVPGQARSPPSRRSPDRAIYAVRLARRIDDRPIPRRVAPPTPVTPVSGGAVPRPRPSRRATS